jgi:hypothetical protein
MLKKIMPCNYTQKPVDGDFLLPTLNIQAVKHLSARYPAPEGLYWQASYPTLNYMGWQQATFG